MLNDSGKIMGDHTAGLGIPPNGGASVREFVCENA